MGPHNGWMLNVSVIGRFGTQYEGKYSDSIANAFPYPSTSYLDDLAWGSVWMYKATMEDQYLQVQSFFQQSQNSKTAMQLYPLPPHARVHSVPGMGALHCSKNPGLHTRRPVKAAVLCRLLRCTWIATLMRREVVATRPTTGTPAPGVLMSYLPRSKAPIRPTPRRCHPTIIFNPTFPPAQSLQPPWPALCP